MKLCFDATRFGCGLDGAVELAAERSVPLLEYCFQPFATSGKGSKSQDDKERKYFASVAAKAEKAGVEFAILNLDYALDPLDKKSIKQFAPMMQKLSAVATALKCPRLGFSVRPGADESWISAFAEQYALLREAALKENEFQPLDYVLRLSTPAEYRGVSLRKWRQLEPHEWRELLSQCEGLSFVYSPADCLWLGIDYLQNMGSFVQAIAHVVAHDVEINRTILTDSGMFGPLWWRYRVAGKGQVDWRQVIELLKLYEYKGALSIQMDDEFIEDDVVEDTLAESVKYFAPHLKG